MSKQVNPEAEAVASFLQGSLAGMVQKAAVDGTLMLKVSEVQQRQDARGDHLDHFIVVTESGIRLKVRVTVE